MTTPSASEVAETGYELLFAIEEIVAKIAITNPALYAALYATITTEELGAGVIGAVNKAQDNHVSPKLLIAGVVVGVAIAVAAGPLGITAAFGEAIVASLEAIMGSELSAQIAAVVTQVAEVAGGTGIQGFATSFSTSALAPFFVAATGNYSTSSFIDPSLSPNFSGLLGVLQGGTLPTVFQSDDGVTSYTQTVEITGGPSSSSRYYQTVTTYYSGLNGTGTVTKIDSEDINGNGTGTSRISILDPVTQLLVTKDYSAPYGSGSVTNGPFIEADYLSKLSASQIAVALAGIVSGALASSDLATMGSYESFLASLFPMNDNVAAMRAPGVH